MIQLCRHILRNNHQCGQPAVNGMLFCRHHRDVKDWKRSSGLRSQITIQTPTQTYDHGTMLVPDSYQPNPPYPVSLEFPEEPAAILTNIYRVTTLLLQGQIDRPTANSVTYGMQVCRSALNGKSLFEPAAAQSPSQSRSHTDSDDSETTYSDPSSPARPVSRPVHRVILTPDGDEIAPPVEILEDNEAEPIHHKGCPCIQCAEKYRNQPPEEHHPNCQCGLCEPEETAFSDQRSDEEGTEPREQGSEQSAEHRAQVSTLPADCHPERTLSEAKGESRDLQFVDSATIEGAPSLANRGPQRARGWRDGAEEPKVGTDSAGCPIQAPVLGLSGHSLRPKPRIARASSLLSGSTSRDPLNRPWSVAEYTFGDAIRRHEAQYAARAAAALAVGIEPPPYQPYTTGLIPPGHPDFEEEQQMQQHSSEYWAAHFRKLIADRPDIQQYLGEEHASEEAAGTGNSPLGTGDCELATGS